MLVRYSYLHTDAVAIHLPRCSPDYLPLVPSPSPTSLPSPGLSLETDTISITSTYMHRHTADPPSMLHSVRPPSRDCPGVALPPTVGTALTSPGCAVTTDRVVYACRPAGGGSGVGGGSDGSTSAGSSPTHRSRRRVSESSLHDVLARARCRHWQLSSARQHCSVMGAATHSKLDITV